MTLQALLIAGRKRCRQIDINPIRLVENNYSKVFIDSENFLY